MRYIIQLGTKINMSRAKNLSCFFGAFLGSSASYAYVIGSDLIVENTTSTPLSITIEQPNAQPFIVKDIPANQTVTIYLENGDSSGWLYQAETAQFSIQDAHSHIEQINGRVAFYIGASYARKYSFIDSLQANKSIQLQKSYSCNPQSNGYVFKNKIRIGGMVSDNPAPILSHLDFIECQSDVDAGSHLEQNNYFLKCTNNEKETKFQSTGYCRGGSSIWFTEDYNTTFSTECKYSKKSLDESARFFTLCNAFGKKYK